MWLKWLPWRFLVRQAARSGGFLDPFKLLSQMQRFSQPSEVAIPIEIFRLGYILQARGMMNGQAIQHNLDWIWPYWAKRQFNPRDPAFIPRAFSMTHINLTHRNWTALGVPGCELYPLVDPRGLVTPFYDSWSFEAWIVTEDKKDLIPSELDAVHQEISFVPCLNIKTSASYEKMDLTSTAQAESFKENTKNPFLRVRFRAKSERKAWLAVSLRPYNPEGVSFVHDIESLKDSPGWCVNGEKKIYFNTQWDRHGFSSYHTGDVYRRLPDGDARVKMHCEVGLATAAALFELDPGKEREVELHMPLKGDEGPRSIPDASAETGLQWNECLRHAASLKVPDKRFQFLYETALYSMVLHAPHEVYPGPFTYKHFWFRDAVLICYAMLCAGLVEHVEKIIEVFWERQTINGYFRSQEGEWDSNGQVLWILHQYCLMMNRPPKPEWKKAVLNGTRWIQKKRELKDKEALHYGLFPAGFSAEHLGPNDYYYWDNFWGVQGLHSAAWIMEKYGESDYAKVFSEQAVDFMECIDRSLKRHHANTGELAVPASPYRRMDAGAIGSLCESYPLRLWPADDPRLLQTTEYLLKNCFLDGAFFHDIAHSGLNPYLTVHIAQVLLRAGDKRYFDILKTVSRLATPTGQWPEAIHPQTLGGCMGDGQHIWAAAEWVTAMRSLFVREEGGKLILASGIPEDWLEENMVLKWGPAPTEFGLLSVEITCSKGHIWITWKGDWHGEEPPVEIRFPEKKIYYAQKGESAISLPYKKKK